MFFCTDRQTQTDGYKKTGKEDEEDRRDAGVGVMLRTKMHVGGYTMVSLRGVRTLLDRRCQHCAAGKIAQTAASKEASRVHFACSLVGRWRGRRCRRRRVWCGRPGRLRCCAHELRERQGRWWRTDKRRCHCQRAAKEKAHKVVSSQAADNKQCCVHRTHTVCERGQMSFC